ncbi:uncharacterized protein YlxW (UPF0749 family) [Kineococcus xinjiangensis]|uniref:Uncharacterized protein YlxW (UPF0749 family) n=1 Tax=Kineococcus xinjiangensis TaxID=512762 RepID=A0A2S6IDD7_9ACTN|nr:DUF881 domain-containing protein [Kineococcus xinjiangensis]PPK92180.1 uncharacterized protein YlxW (UPF0749 family) [Kineococcus xinjiangensis]
MSPGTGEPTGAAGPGDLGPGDPGPGGSAVPAPGPPRRSAWARLARAARPRATRGQVLAGVLSALLGFAVVAQVRQTQAQGLEELSESELVRILSDTSDRSERLEEEARRLERTRSELTAGGDGAEAAARAARQRLVTYSLLAGTVAAQGPGIVLRIEDAAGTVRAGTLLDAVQELRDAGAEALQLGPVRVVASTALADAPGGGVLVDGQQLRPPYELTAVGDPDTLAPALDIPGGVLEGVRSRGGTATVTPSERVEVTAVRPAPDLRWATPVPPAPGP